MGGMLMPMDIREEFWVVVWEGMVIVIGEVDGEEVTFWARIILGDEEMSRTEVLVDETCKIVALIDDDETDEVS